jgi:bacillithiol biosynthesis cysteine-adding enzyme BshC
MKTESLTPIIEELFRSFGPPGAECENLKKLIEECYLNNETIANATQLIVHKLFGHYGLVVLNPDDANFKKEILPIMQDDLLNNSSLNIVQSQSQKLAERYKAQAFPRLINLFYLTDNIRERIEQKGEIWQVINTEIRFTKEELITELENHPEKFSPNVILRGLLQESILPNVCFIGGGSELAYWLQLKPLFEYHNVFYPVIYLRQSVQIISEEAWILMKQLGLNFEDVFVPTDDLIHKWILDKKGESWLLIEEKKVLENAFEALKIRALKIDTTLEKSASAVLTKMRHQIDVLEQKMYRAEKRKEQLNRTRLDKLKLMLLPNGALQERLENFMPYYLQNGFSIFATIKDEIKPFDNQFLIVYPSKIKD